MIFFRILILIIKLKRKKVFVYRQKLKINKLISQLIVYLEDGKIFVEGNLTNIWLDSEVNWLK